MFRKKTRSPPPPPAGALALLRATCCPSSSVKRRKRRGDRADALGGPHGRDTVTLCPTGAPLRGNNVSRNQRPPRSRGPSRTPCLPAGPRRRGACASPRSEPAARPSGRSMRAPTGPARSSSAAGSPPALPTGESMGKWLPFPRSPWVLVGVTIMGTLPGEAEGRAGGTFSPLGPTSAGQVSRAPGGRRGGRGCLWWVPSLHRLPFLKTPS